MLTEADFINARISSHLLFGQAKMKGGFVNGRELDFPLLLTKKIEEVANLEFEELKKRRDSSMTYLRDIIRAYR